MVNQHSKENPEGHSRSSAQLLPTSTSPLSPTLSSPKSLSSYRSSGSGSETATAMSPAVEPIAISSNSTTSFAPPPPFSPPVFGSSTSSAAASLNDALDGPLHDLLPALSISTGASSSDESALTSRSLVSTAPPTSAGRGRRVIPPGLSAYASSPSRSSPLSQSWDDSSADEALWFRRPPPFGLPVSLPSSPDFGSPPSRYLSPPCGLASSPPSPSSFRRRRRSSLSLSASAGSSAPPFGSLVGSFENSLLSGRMSALPSLPLPFVASIGVLGSPDSPARLRCPQHLHVPFSAIFYSPPGEVSAASPYVGTVDLDAHYHSLLEPRLPAEEKDGKLPRFPGYQVPPRGQVQLVLKNSNRTAFKPFLIPYDLTGLDRDGRGGRTFLRQKSYAVDELDERGKLRFAVHLQFCSPPSSSTSSKGKNATTGASEPKFYLYHNIRLVFASRGLDASDKLRVVLEGPEELMYGAAGGGAVMTSERFSAYSGPGKEWETARKKAKERERMKNVEWPALSSAIDDDDDTLRPSTTVYNSLSTCDTQSGTTLYTAYTPSLTAASPIPPLLPSHVSSPPLVSLPFLPSSAAAAIAAEPLTFDRVSSPRPPFLADIRERKLSVSNLSASRPASRNETTRAGSGERERERCGR
ncbi:hypothetical protein JCM11251_000680 [Rhodosporidiobolus azoricus]